MNVLILSLLIRELWHNPVAKGVLLYVKIPTQKISTQVSIVLLVIMIIAVNIIILKPLFFTRIKVNPKGNILPPCRVWDMSNTIVIITINMIYLSVYGRTTLCDCDWWCDVCADQIVGSKTSCYIACELEEIKKKVGCFGFAIAFHAFSYSCDEGRLLAGLSTKLTSEYLRTKHTNVLNKKLSSTKINCTTDTCVYGSSNVSCLLNLAQKWE